MTTALEVADLDRSERLYRDAFGLDLHRSLHGDSDRWTGGDHAATSWTEGAFVHFALYQSKDGAQTTGAQVAFAVEDIADAHERAVAAGAELVHEPRDEPWGRSARYRDPDGNVIELTQRFADRAQAFH
ncbi:MAG: VOC family protein [Dehalococcoidia bacterium]